MTLFIRNNNNNTIIEVEIYKKSRYVEVHASIDAIYYAELLNNYYKSNKNNSQLVADMSSICEIRQWLYEVFEDNSVYNFKAILTHVKELMKSVADRHVLAYVED